MFEKYLPLRLNLQLTGDFNQLLADVIDRLAEHDKWHLSYVPGDEPRAAAPSFRWDEGTWTRTVADVLFVEHHIKSVPHGGPLDLLCRRSGKSIDLVLTFDPATYTADDASAVIERFERVLRQVCEGDDVALHAIDVLTAQERSVLLERAKGEQVVITALFPEMFEQQAQKTSCHLWRKTDQLRLSG